MGRFRFGILLGFAIGYVAGSAAGRNRYEQIKGFAQKVWDSPTIQPIREQAGRRVVRIEGTMREAARRMTAGETSRERVSPRDPFAASSDQNGGRQS